MNIMRDEFQISCLYDVCIFLITSYSLSETYICMLIYLIIIIAKKIVDVRALTFPFFSSSFFAYYSEAVDATECKSMMMMIEQ
jgi:hypothetical protein